MAENLMETQTGGAGDTTQLAPETPVTPEQFDVQLPNVGQQQETAAPTPADSEPPATPPAAPPTEPPSPVVQQSLLDVENQAEDEQAGAELEQEQGPLVSQLPFSAAKQPVGADVGFVDWFSGDATKSIEDEENKAIEMLMNEEMPQPNIITQNEIETINSQKERSPFVLDGIVVDEGVQLGEDEEGVMPSFAVEDSEEDERFQDFVLDGIGPSDEMRAAGLDPKERIPKDYTPAQWAEKKKEIQTQYPGWDVVVSDDGSGVKVVKEEVKKQQPKPVSKGGTVKQAPKQNVVNQILTYPKNPGSDYMTDGTHWYKKKSGTKNWLTITNDGSVTTLNNHFKTNVPKVTKYTYPNKPYEYAVVKGHWNIRKKGDTNWKMIYEPERIKVLNGSFNKKLGVPVQLSESQKQLNRAVAVAKQAGMSLSSPKIGAVSTDSEGNPITATFGLTSTGGTNLASAPDYGGLFTPQQRPSMPIVPASTQERWSKENIAGLENQRKIELDAINRGAGTPQMKQKEIASINKRFDALVNKEKSNIQGAKEYEKEATKQVFTAPLPEKVKKEIDLSDQINKQFGINIAKDNIPLLDLNLGLVNKITDQQKEETLDRAQNFADKDLDAWRKSPEGKILSESQFNELKAAQTNVKMSLGLGGDKGDVSFVQVGNLMKQLPAIEQSYAMAVKTNNEINQAALEGKTIDEYSLDYKKKFVKEIDLNNEALVHAKDLFNATAAIHDFVSPYIKSGKVTIDKNGMYRKGPNMNANEKKYFDEKLGGLLQAYDKEKNTSYNTYQDDIRNLNAKKKVLNDMLQKQQGVLFWMKTDPARKNEYQLALKRVEALKKRISDVDSKIDDFSNSSRAFFSTDAKSILSSTSSFMKNSDFKAIYMSANSKLTPKQKFDISYKTLVEENKKLALQNNINTSYLDAVGARVRSLLDWNTLGIELTEPEKKWFANQKIINQLRPLFLNNENGIVEESASFMESFQAGIRNITVGEDIAGAEGYYTGTSQARTISEQIINLGFNKEDLANPLALKDIEQRKNVSWISAEGAGEITAPTAMLIAEIMVTRQVGASLMALGKTVANMAKVVDATGDAIGYGDKMSKLYKSYATVMQNSRLGRYTFDAVEQGVLFEATGEFFGRSEDNMTFLQGFAGSFAGSAMGDLMSKIPVGKAMPIVQSIFGDKTEQAINVFKKAGQINANALGETFQETAEELAGIYQNRLEGEGFFEAVSNQFGSFDEVMKFVVSSYVMGAGFGLAVPKKAQEAYNSMSEEKKKQIDDTVTAVRKDYEDASAAYDNAAQVLKDEVEVEINLNAEPESQADIDSKQENAGILLGGEPTPEAEGKIQEGEVTEAEVEQKKQDDTEDKTGLPSEVREGEKPVEAEPFPEASQEEVSPSGVVQEKQEVAPTEGGLQFELPTAGTEAELTPTEVTESTLTREFDLSEEQVVEEATEEVADIMADEKLSEEQKEEKIDEVVVKTKKRKTAAKMRGGDMSISTESSKELKQEIKAKAEPKVEDKKVEKEEAKGEVRMPSKPKLFISGIARGFEDFSGGEGPGDRRDLSSELDYPTTPNTPARSRGVFVRDINGKKYVIAVSNTDANGNRIREVAGNRPGHLQVAVEVDKNASKEEINDAVNYVGKAMGMMLPNVRNGQINSGLVKESAKGIEGRVASSILESKVKERKAKKEEAPAKTEEKTDIEKGADLLSSMTEEERDNFIDDWYNDRIPRESLPGGNDAVLLNEARKIASKPMSKPKRVNIDNAFQLSNEYGFVMNIDGEVYGLYKIEDPDATSDAEDRYGDPKEYVWAYKNLRDGTGNETYLSDINDLIDDIRSNKKAKAEAPTETKTETPVEAEAKANPFEDLPSIKGLPSRSPKRKQAIADFDSKHGEGAYERVSKIDAKFGEITKKLEENKVIKKDC